MSFFHQASRDIVLLSASLTKETSKQQPDSDGFSLLTCFFFLIDGPWFYGNPTMLFKTYIV